MEGGKFERGGDLVFGLGWGMGALRETSLHANLVRHEQHDQRVFEINAL